MQKSVRKKLAWDEKTLEFAFEIGGKEMKIGLPSLYLNIAKGHEDLHNWAKARS